MKLPEGYGPEDYLGWLKNPLTQAFFADLLSDRQMIMEAWARRSYVGATTDETIQLNAVGLAQIKTIDELLQNMEESQEDARSITAEKLRNE